MEVREKQERDSIISKILHNELGEPPMSISYRPNYLSSVSFCLVLIYLLNLPYRTTVKITMKKH